MYSNKPIIYKKEHRKRPDFICKWLEIATILVWISLFSVIFLFSNAQPRDETFFDRLFGVKPEKNWNYGILNTALYIMVFVLVLSVISLILNLKRMKRSTDRIRTSFIISIIGSFSGILFILLRF